MAWLAQLTKWAGFGLTHLRRGRYEPIFLKSDQAWIYMLHTGHEHPFAMPTSDRFNCASEI